MPVALITCREKPEPDPDEPLLLAALLARGVDAAMHAWDGDGPPPAGALLVLRSAWNYHLDPPRFLGWLSAVAARCTLCNARDVVRWNLHKRYLIELAGRNLPVVPTVFVDRGARVSFAAIARANGWQRAVVKPAVSAASFRTRSFAAGDAAAQPFLDQLLAERDVMIQRYQASVERGGERALVWIAGEWTHAVRKAARFDGGDEQVSAAEPLAPGERELGDRALAALAGMARQLLYARLDLIEGDDGAPLVSELELIEPSLFLLQHPPALERFAAAIAARALAR